MRTDGTKMSNIIQKLGSSAFLDLTQYLRVTPYVVLFSVFVGAGTREQIMIAAEMFGQLLAIGLSWCWFLVGDKLLFQNRKQSPIGIWAMLGFGLGLASLNMVGYWSGVWILGQGELMFQYFGLMAADSLVFGVGSVLSLSAFKVVSGELLKERNALIVNSLEEEIAQQQETQLAIIRLKLKEAFGERRSGLGASTSTLIARLNEILESDVRQASRKLWASKVSFVPSYEIGRILGPVLSTRPFLMRFAIPLGLLPALFMVIGELDPLLTALVMAVNAVLLGSTQLLANWLAGSTVKTGYMPFVLASVIAPILIVTFTTAVEPEINGSLPVAVFMLGIWLLIVNTSLALASGIVKTRAQIIAGLKEIDASRAAVTDLSQAEPLVRREVANLLHSEVQSQILSIVERLKNPETQREDLSKSLPQLETELLLALTVSRADPITLQQVLEQIKQRWLGIVEITHFVSTSESEIAFLPIGQVLDEAVSNAVRHGAATEVQIKITSHGDQLSIQVSDNGYGPRSGEKGLGSELFAASSAGYWSLTAGKSAGSVLNILL